MRRHLRSQSVNAIVKLLDLAANIRVLSWQRLQPLQLLFNSS
jgi:hypothetical protein